jgi:hypothetical protein
MKDQAKGVNPMAFRYTNSPVRESRDGIGAGDHDEPYVFGRVPRAIAPFPFSTREFARLLVMRSRVQDGRLVERPISVAGVQQYE